MIVVAALAGLLVGSLLNWAAALLPRFAADPALRTAGVSTRPRLALWQWLSAVPGQRSKRPADWVWSGAAAELLTAGLFGYVWSRYGLTWESALTVASCAFFVLAAIIDVRHRLVPNVLVFPAIALALMLHLVSPQGDILVALEGGALGLVMFTLAALLKPGGLGGGDVKLATLIGLIFGFPYALWALTVGILAGGAAAVYLMLARRWRPSSQIPYAPFLCLGAIVALMYNPLLTLF